MGVVPRMYELAGQVGNEKDSHKTVDSLVLGRISSVA